jgi:hypothetical protein
VGFGENDPVLDWGIMDYRLKQKGKSTLLSRADRATSSFGEREGARLSRCSGPSGLLLPISQGWCVIRTRRSRDTVARGLMN